MLLGIDSIDMIVRTVIPAAALSILVGMYCIFFGVQGMSLTESIGIVTAFGDALVVSRARASTLPPEAPSPRDLGSRDLQSRDISTSDSDYPPSRYEDLKGGDITSVNAFALPREAPRPTTRPWQNTGAESLPTIQQPVPGQAVAGIGGLPVQGELFPPMRAQTAPAPKQISRAESVRPKRSLFDLSRGGPASAVTVGKLTISNPIIQAGDEQNPLKKIATIDLATAARNERERRDLALQRSSSLIAKRPAPPPPSMSPEEAMKRSQSVKRKEVASMSQGPPKAQPVEIPPTELMPNNAAKTTSSQLSPGVEEIRRRSPRQPPDAFNEKESEMRPITPVRQPEARTATPPARPRRPASPEIASERAASPPRPPMVEPAVKNLASPRQATAQPPSPENRAPTPPQEPKADTLPRNASVKNTIRPSRQRPPSPPPVEEVVAPTVPVKTRPTTGLPSNPRAQAMRTLAKEAGVQREQTVMFINNIEYNDPTTVQSIISGANDMVKSAKSPGDGIKSGKSVVHRPRPIPRKPDKDRAIFPAEPSPNQHKRTRSGGSISSRKSILRSNPGSPTQLPPLPLPPPPKSAGTVLRPLPNDTKSMTFDEKMTLLFPSPPSASSTTISAKRREEVPEMPTVPAAFLDMSPSPDYTDRESVHTRRSDRTTKTSIRTGSVLEIDEIPRPPMNPSKFSVDTYNLTDEVGQTWLPGISTEPEARVRPSYDGAKRQSSPVLGLRPRSPSELTDIKTQGGGVTDWGSVHSPVAAVNIQQARHVPKATYIPAREPTRNEQITSVVESNDGRDSMSMTIMLDPSTPHERFAHRQSYYDETNMPRLGSVRRESRWHRRVGDDCPTFSDRKEIKQSGRMPPPTPLLLNLRSNKNAIVVQPSEPSPLESPRQALEMIQAQLKKFEQPSRESVESQGQRLALLENLELEMAGQENHWLEMQHDMGRDSVSTLKTSPNRDSVQEPVAPNPPSRDASQRSNIAADRRASRRARMRSGSIARASVDMATPSSQSSEGTRASLWQQRLAEAQMEYMENASDLIAQRNVNFLTLSKAQLGSPTPPDTDESDSEGLDSRLMGKRTSGGQAADDKKLWAPTPTTELPTPSTAILWTPGPKSSPMKLDTADVPVVSVRPVSRKSTEPLSIESTQLWQTTTETREKKARPTAINGLWPGSLPKSQKSNPRPVTQRPPRRSRRVTLLPDILESPEPLPDKRGTLGIFQFPWGEKSDTATIHTRPSHVFMPMPGTMSSGVSALNAAMESRSKQLEAQEYSSSFFDDYDDEEEDEVSDIEEDGSDDGFDETTLWEIASLLKTDQVPSKNSLLPEPMFREEPSFVEDYNAEASSDEEDDDDTRPDSTIVVIEADDFPMPPRPESKLWDQKAALANMAKNKGLPQPDDRTWKNYVPNSSGTVRVQPRKAAPASVESETLWDASHKPAQGGHRSHLWSQKMSMWTPPAKTKTREPKGLFSLSHKRTDFRTTEAEPAALHMIRQPRVSREALPRLTSNRLWTASSPTAHRPNWIFGKYAVRKLPSPKVRAIPSSHASLKEPTWWESRQPELPVRSNSKKTLANATMRRRNRDNAIYQPVAASHPARVARPAATSADWDAALLEAMTRGHLVRKTATPADWDAALEEAISQTLKHDVTKRHPVFAATSMVSTSEWFHPAATGYTYDPAVVNPVFFGSLAITSEEVHPAMSAYAAKKLRRKQSKNIARDRRMSRSDSRGRRNKEEILAQIKAIETAEEIAVPPVSASPVEEQTRSHSRGNTSDLAKRAMIKAIETVEEIAVPPVTASPAEERTRSHSRGNTSDLAKRAMIKAQIKAIEEEQDPQQVTMLWSKASKAATAKSPVSDHMWTPPKATKDTLPEAATKEVEASSHRNRRDRKAEILAQIAAIEKGMDPSALGIGWGGLWSVSAGDMRAPERRSGGDQNWLDDSSKRRINRVQFRY
jgi:hypothetical protein